jgi:hypothetical protein
MAAILNYEDWHCNHENREKEEVVIKGNEATKYCIGEREVVGNYVGLAYRARCDNETCTGT